MAAPAPAPVPAPAPAKTLSLQWFLRIGFQYLLSPVLVVLIGVSFNAKIEETKRAHEKLELELKQIEAAQKMLQELFSGTPQRAFIAESLLTKILDKAMADEIRRLVTEYYQGQIATTKRPNEIENIAAAARAIDSPAAKLIAESLARKSFYVVAGSHKNPNSAMRQCDSLRKHKEYAPEVYITETGVYAVTLGKFGFDLAHNNRTSAIAAHLIAADSFLSPGQTFVRRIYPK